MVGKVSKEQFVADMLTRQKQRKDKLLQANRDVNDFLFGNSIRRYNKWFQTSKGLAQRKCH